MRLSYFYKIERESQKKGGMLNWLGNLTWGNFF